MKKTGLSFLVIIILILSIIIIFTACGEEEEPTKDPFKINYIVDNLPYDYYELDEDLRFIISPKTPTKDGYYFVGWYYDNNVWKKPFNSTSLYNTTITSDINVYARWEKIENPCYTITWYDPQTRTSTTSTVELDQIPECNLDFPQSYVDDRGITYEFSGWLPEISPAIQDESYYAQYKIKEGSAVSIRIRQNIPEAGSIYGTSDGVIMTGIGRYCTISTSVNPGYKFLGWFENGRRLSSGTACSLNASYDRTIVASYEKLSYSFQVESNDTNVGNITYSIANSAPLTVSNATKDVYYNDLITLEANNLSNLDFLGWYKGDSLYSSNPKLSFNIDESLSLLAKWELKAYNITYVLSDATNNASNPSSFTIEDDINILDPSKPYNDFIGWYLEDTYQTKVTTSKQFGNNDITLFAKLEPLFTFDGDTLLSITNYTKQKYTTIEIPSFVTSIGNSAFENWTKLTSLTIPKTVQSVGAGILAGCSNLASLTTPFVGISRDDPSTNEFPLEYFFRPAINPISNRIYYPNKLDSVTVTDITTIPDSAFMFFNGKNITIPDNVTSIEDNAFYGCHNLTSFSIPTTIDTIGYRVFHGAGLTSITIPTNIKTIGREAFEGTEITSLVIPSTLTSIGDMAFQETKITTLTIPSTVSVGQYAFGRCKDLESASFSNGVTKVPGAIFIECTALTSVSLPNTLTTIGSMAFQGCEALESISIPSSVTIIDDQAFAYCKKLGNVILPAGLEDLGFYTFNGCSSITSITIPEKISIITIGLFKNCTSLKTVIHNSTKSGVIFEYAFYGCSSLESFVVNDNIYYIYKEAFYGCSSLQQVTMGRDISRINTDAFSGCSSLQEITFKNTSFTWNAGDNVVDISNPIANATYFTTIYNTVAWDRGVHY